jgi:hypothetical protein
MGSDNVPCRLKEEITNKKSILNNLILNGIDDKLIELSQELDILINDYTKTVIKQ